MKHHLNYGLAFCLVLGIGALAMGAENEPNPIRTVHANVQMRPGGEFEEVDVPVYESPNSVPNLAAEGVAITDDDLILGVVADGEAVAFPVRFLSSYEVVNGRVGKIPVAPSW